MTENRRKLRMDKFTNACLIIDRGVFPLSRETISIGRKLTNDCVINDLSVSRQHARIAYEDESFVLYDTGSTLGTFVNNQRVEKVVLHSGDIILFGQFPVMFILDDPKELAKYGKATGHLRSE